MAPEVQPWATAVMGGHIDYAKADLWSIGCILCFMCAPNCTPTTIGQLQTLHRFIPSEKDAELAQNLSQLQPFLAVFPQERMGHLASFGPT